VIGCAQILALVPGTSRSGITLTAGLSLGFKRVTSAKFSFLLSIPAIFLAGSYEGLKAVSAGINMPWLYLITGILVAALSAYFCIHAFLKLIAKIGVMPFVWYRLFLGLFLIWFFY
jgi:undecaprenyl-diphosphatase